MNIGDQSDAHMHVLLEVQEVPTKIETNYGCKTACKHGIRAANVNFHTT